MNARTASYHVLHRTYGDVSATYDSTWSYDVDSVALHDRVGSAEISGSAIELSRHVFTTGQAVVYHAGGGTIDGLVDGTTYYVVVDASNASVIRLAATLADAGTNTTLGFTWVSGDSHWFSDGDVLSQRAKWSEAQLKNSISASILRPKTVSGTSSTTEDPNITGSEIALVVSGEIGSADVTMDITLADINAGLSEEQKIALAAAEKQDVTFYDTEGNVMEPDDVGKTFARLHINVKNDVDFKTEGLLTVSAGTGANLGSDQTADVRVDRITSTDGEVRLKVQGNIINARTDGGYNIRSDGAVLEAEDGSIGTQAKPFLIDMIEAGRTGALTARAKTNVYLQETSGDLYVSSVYAETFIDLRSAGSMLDADNDDATTRAWNIYSPDAYLRRGRAAPSAPTERLETDLQGGVRNADAGQSIYLYESAGDLIVGVIKSANANVSLGAALSIHDDDEGVEGNPSPDVIGNSITLTAGFEIGAANDYLDIDTAFSGAGTLTSASEFNTFLIEISSKATPAAGDEDLSLYSVATNAGTAFITAPTGSIHNGRTDGGSNVISGKTYLFAGLNIGAEDKRIMTSWTTSRAWPLGEHLDHEHLGPHRGRGRPRKRAGFLGGGAVNITASCTIDVKEDVISETDYIVLTATERAADVDDLIVRDGITVWSKTSYVTLRAGDDVTLEEGSFVLAAGKVTISGDYGSADAAGTPISLLGVVGGSEVEVNGNADDDTIILERTHDSVIYPSAGVQAAVAGTYGNVTNVYAYRGNDTVTIRSIDGQTNVYGATARTCSPPTPSRR